MSIEELKELKELIEFIAAPFYFTDHGNKYAISNTDGIICKGSQVQAQTGGRVKVLSNTGNSDCVGGACPIK